MTMYKRNARANNNQLLTIYQGVHITHFTNNNQLKTYYLCVHYLLKIQQYPVNSTYNNYIAFSSEYLSLLVTLNFDCCALRVSYIFLFQILGKTIFCLALQSGI